MLFISRDSQQQRVRPVRMEAGGEVGSRRQEQEAEAGAGSSRTGFSDLVFYEIAANETTN
jgi:hypothetical protein